MHRQLRDLRDGMRLREQKAMNKITVKIDGMVCGMCEAHLCDALRKAFPAAKKVAASRRKGEATFLSESEVDETTLKRTINDTGYTFVSVTTEPDKKHGLFRS